MTRTARSTYPRALQKDRSESRSGLDPFPRKGGAGQHNWGSLTDERELEASALNDENAEFEETATPTAGRVAEDTGSVEDAAGSPHSPTPSASASASSQPGLSRSDSGLSGDELEEARKFRKHALNKKGIDLSAIARTSVAASTSPPRAESVRRAASHDTATSNNANKQAGPIADTTTI